MFVNFSNHRSSEWSQAQISAAAVYGEIVDVPFPDVSATALDSDIKKIALEYVTAIINMNPTAVMCQGEFTLAFAVIAGLKRQGITVLAACSERKVYEKSTNGITKKTTNFEFSKFREYVE